jgi:putrescine transport system substrate-binding protein
MRTWSRAALVGAGCALAACGGAGGSNVGEGTPAEQTLNVYNWSDYIAPDTVANFERETGIKVRYSTIDSKEELETKLLTGHTGYDIVVPADVFFERLLKAGVFRKQDFSQLPNRVNLDPEIMRQLAVHDPGNLYAVPYLWTTVGIGYNVDKVKQRLPGADLDSWSLLLDPRNAEKLKDCGIQVIDSPLDVLSSMLIYLGKDTTNPTPGDLGAAADVLMRIRPYVRSIASTSQIDELAGGSLCMLLGWSGDVNQARYRALDAVSGIKIRYVVPREGAINSVDMMSIPADAPHPQNAEKWLNYLMRPEVMAAITNAVKFPNGNIASLPFVADAIKNDMGIYPGAATIAKLHPLPATSPDQARVMTRLWTRFRTGQ